MTENRIPVRLGELRVGRPDDVLVTVGLGSCVAVALYDPESRVGGLAHVMLPDPSSARSATPIGRFGSTAVAALIDVMEAQGANRENVFARLVGGATMFEGVLTGPTKGLGERNVLAVRRALDAAGVPVHGENVGGAHGRSVYFHIDDGRVLVTSVRQGNVVL